MDSLHLHSRSFDMYHHYQASHINYQNIMVVFRLMINFIIAGEHGELGQKKFILTSFAWQQ